VDTKHQRNITTRAGQALIELCIGMVSLIILVAVIAQLAMFVRASHETSVRAREQAGALALSDYPLSVTAPYIGETEAGADAKPYTKDDEFADGDASAYYRDILDPLAAEPTDWNTLEEIPGNGFSGLRASASPMQSFGLLRGKDEEVVPLLPAVRSLLYRADSIQMEETVWMPWTKGVY